MEDNVRNIVRSTLREISLWKRPDFDHGLFNLFLEEMADYQSNHYDTYNRSLLVEAYNNLPDNIKAFISTNRIGGLYRGCDGAGNPEKPAISFTKEEKFARFFGTFAVPSSEIQLYLAAIRSDRVSLLSHKIKSQYEIGDDEGEIIILGVVWKSGIENRLETNYRG